MVRRDLPKVREIERRCFEYPWNETDFEQCLRQRSCIGMVAERAQVVAGFMVYKVRCRRIQLVNLGVQPEYHRRGVGRELIEKLIGKLKNQGRTEIYCEVRERNLAAQLFLRSLGFRVSRIERQYYDAINEDCYVFKYLHKRER